MRLRTSRFQRAGVAVSHGYRNAREVLCAAKVSTGNLERFRARKAWAGDWAESRILILPVRNRDSQSATLASRQIISGRLPASARSVWDSRQADALSSPLLKVREWPWKRAANKHPNIHLCH